MTGQELTAVVEMQERSGKECFMSADGGGTMLATITAITGLLGLIASLVFVAIQTRAMTEQVRMANNLNGTNAVDLCLNNVREIYFKMLEYPECGSTSMRMRRARLVRLSGNVSC
ncbi:hypothetical protein [Streptomyces apricus]|uniref:Uncharacterized protein n=1 Tax=Streptomyces apricus TaxID=1828112 RepID=A0A5B0A3V1_9ACTN|nr:hypothetical protein [Streptomyces apricus]KAA0924254.1 hypothetical protein FGF04_33065 [Streptomyces apricus]